MNPSPPGGRRWVVDFEFRADEGHRPEVWCGVFFCLETEETLRLTFDKPGVPCPVDPELDTVIAFYASAEMNCFLSLGWPLPRRVYDLYPEAKVVRGQVPARDQGKSWGLLAVAASFGVSALAAEKKEFFRAIAVRGPSTPAEWAELLAYCETDVVTTTALYLKIAPLTDPRQALLRGAYVATIARMEHHGTPLDGSTWARLRKYWPRLLDRQTEIVNKIFPVYQRNPKGAWVRSFALWKEVMSARGILWPLTECGRPATDQDTMKTMATLHPELQPLRELETNRGQFRLGLGLAVGPDGRNRCMLSPYGTITSRGSPSNASFIFGPSVWVRSLILAPPGRCLLYCDLSAAEIGIGGALAKDTNLLADYLGDPYLNFAVAAGLAPPGASKQTHGRQRDIAKQVVLGLNYGMGRKSLALALGVPPSMAGHLIEIHKNRYRKFWGWVATVQSTVAAGRPLVTRYGWRWLPKRDSFGEVDFNPRAAQNWPCQAACAEILRLAAIRLAAGGVFLCCPVHDALLVEGPAHRAEALATQVRDTWAEASQDVIGIPLKSSAEILLPGERYSDPRGASTWTMVMTILDALELEDLSATRQFSTN